MYSRKSLRCCLIYIILITGCYNAPSPSREVIDPVIQNYLNNPCDNLKIDNYLNKISLQLQKNILREKIYKFRISPVKEPLSFFIKPNIILFSKGFLERLATESALAFVMAHEMSHDILGHTSIKYSEANEIEADNNAIKIIERTNYSLEEGISALTRFRTKYFEQIKNRITNSFDSSQKLDHSGYNIGRREFYDFQGELQRVCGRKIPYQ